MLDAPTILVLRRRSGTAVRFCAANLLRFMQAYLRVTQPMWTAEEVLVKYFAWSQESTSPINL